MPWQDYWFILLDPAVLLHTGSERLAFIYESKLITVLTSALNNLGIRNVYSTGSFAL